MLSRFKFFFSGFSDNSDDFLYVKSNSTPSAELATRWSNYLHERQNLLKIPSTTTFDFIKQFPVFTTNDNFIFQLLKSDVISIYPYFSDIKTFYDKVFKKLSLVNDTTAQHFLEGSENLNEGKKHKII